jgi:hypothetical protein
VIIKVKALRPPGAGDLGNASIFGEFTVLPVEWVE